ncbi:MAG: hypothetical protein IKB34_04275 [Clostridia bacterium]|nr:hypothetical protein [Clostridia bacterium]
MGEYYEEGPSGLGLNSKQLIGYKNYRSTLIFNNSAIYASLTNIGGIIIDASNQLYYFGTQKEYLTPTPIADNCRKATASYKTVCFLTTSDELYLLDISNPQDKTLIMSDVKDIQYKGANSVCVLTNDGQLYRWKDFSPLKAGEQPELLAQNVEAFSCSPSRYSEETLCFGYIDLDGNAYVKLHEYPYPKRINNDTKATQIVATHNGVGILSETGRVLYYGDDFLSSDSYQSEELHTNAKYIYASDSSLSLVTNNGNVLFWGVSENGCFGRKGAHIYRIPDEPCAFDPSLVER